MPTNSEISLHLVIPREVVAVCSKVKWMGSNSNMCGIFYLDSLVSDITRNGLKDLEKFKNYNLTPGCLIFLIIF